MFETLNINYQRRKFKILRMDLLIAYLFLFSACSRAPIPRLYYFYRIMMRVLTANTRLFTHPAVPVGLKTHLKESCHTKYLFISISKYKNLSSSSFRKQLQITSINIIHCSYSNSYKNSFKFDVTITGKDYA